MPIKMNNHTHNFSKLLIFLVHLWIFIKNDSINCLTKQNLQRISSVYSFFMIYNEKIITSKKYKFQKSIIIQQSKYKKQKAERYQKFSNQGQNPSQKINSPVQIIFYETIQKQFNKITMQSSPPSSNSLSSHTMNSFSQQELFDQYSITQTNLQSINTFLNSYQILKKIQIPIIDIRPYMLQKSKTNHVQFQGSQGLTKGLTHGASLAVLTKDSSFKQFKKKEDQISQKSKTKQELSLIHIKSNSSDIETYSASTTNLRLPADNQFVVLHSDIKCTNLLTRVRTMSNGDDLSQRPMFAYPQWNQVSDGVKKIFNKILQTQMKQLNTGTLISIRPKQSLSIRTDYYCFHPHQVYTTFLALDKVAMNSGTLGFCRLNKQFIDTQFPKYNDQHELLDTINREKKEVQWDYLELKEGDLIIVGKDVLYGSFRNDSPSTKFYAEMRWVRHESASNSSNSS